MELEERSSDFPDNKKICKILQKFLEPNVKIKNDVHLNLFFTRLVGKNEAGKSTRFKDNEQLKTQFCQWLIQASDLWIKSNVSPPVTVLSFALNLTSQLCEDEDTFSHLNGQNIFENLIKVAQANSDERPNITAGIITLFCSFLEHKNGVQWVMAASYWNRLLNLGLNADTTIYNKQKVYQFIVKLIEKTITLNTTFTGSLIKLLIMPLKEVLNSLLSDDEPLLTQSKDIEFFEFLKPTLHLVSEVLTILLKNFNANALRLFLERDISDTIEQLLLFSQNQDFTFELLKIQVVFLFYNMRLKLDQKNSVAHNATLLDVKALFDLISTEVDKNSNFKREEMVNTSWQIRNQFCYRSQLCKNNCSVFANIC